MSEKIIETKIAELEQKKRHLHERLSLLPAEYQVEAGLTKDESQICFVIENYKNSLLEINSELSSINQELLAYYELKNLSENGAKTPLPSTGVTLFVEEKSIAWRKNCTELTGELHNDAASNTLVGTILSALGIVSAPKATMNIYAQPQAGASYRKSIDFTANNDGSGDITLRVNGAIQLKANGQCVVLNIPPYSESLPSGALYKTSDNVIKVKS